MKQNEEILDLVKSYPKYDHYKKKYSRGNNFSFKFVILAESRDEYDPKGLFESGVTHWEEMRERWKVSRDDMVKLVEKKKIKHRWQDPYNKKFFEGYIEFKDREPSEKQWKKEIDEMNRSNRKFWLIVGGIIFLVFLYFNK